MPPVRGLGGLQNLGPKSQAMLAAAGIHSLEQLRKLGSVHAYLLVKATGANASINLLWALGGALTGLPWQVVAREHRLSLLLALEVQENQVGPITQARAQAVAASTPPAHTPQ